MTNKTENGGSGEVAAPIDLQAELKTAKQRIADLEWNLRRAHEGSSSALIPPVVAAELPPHYATLFDDGYWRITGREPYPSIFAGWKECVYSERQMRAALARAATSNPWKEAVLEELGKACMDAPIDEPQGLSQSMREHRAVMATYQLDDIMTLANRLDPNTRQTIKRHVDRLREDIATLAAPASVDSDEALAAQSGPALIPTADVDKLYNTICILGTGNEKLVKQALRAAIPAYLPQSEIEAIAESVGATNPDDSLWREFAHAVIDAYLIL